MKRLINYIPCFIIVVSLSFIAVNNIVHKNVSVLNEKNTTPLVVIDAGHGGQDGGAVADDGTQEQYINLDIALKLNDSLTKKGYNCILTRKDNNSIHDDSAKTIREQKVSDIHNRLKIIEDNPNCIFVSIHQNYYTQSQYSGAQVFYSPNNSLSIKLAQSIQASIVNTLQPENNRQIKESGKSIYVLYNAKEPAVLVECGFLSNKEETEKLNNEQYRQQMADCICEGIINYITYNQNEVESKGES